MHLSLNWLKDFVDIPKKIAPEELGRLLTLHTVEIDSVQKQSDKFKNVVVAKIIEINKHPNADRLRLAKVDTGVGILEVVCGAPNIEAGQMVPMALIGAVLPNGLEIKEAEMRGVKSSGMLCAPDELGLGEDHSGIMILDKKARIGMPLAEHLKMDDTVFEVDNKSITHRPDLWSHLGIAREIAAFLNTKLTSKAKELSQGKLKIKVNNKIANIKVKVEDRKLCPRYMALAIDGIKIGPSPKWMEDRLIAAGIRPINNIVDVTNYVMLDVGQPMHAFDLIKLNPEFTKKEEFNVEIRVRRAKKGEIIMSLDGKERELEDYMLVIADKENPVAIAGVMGGATSEISDETNSIVLESANFDFIAVRKTSRELGLRSESSMRFEKSLDPNLCEIALARAVELIKKICPSAKVISETADEKYFKLDTGPLKISLNWLEERIGAKIGWKEVDRILTGLGFGVTKKDDELSIIIPTWRATGDIAIREDILEEVARVYGYNNIAPAMPEIKISYEPREKNQVLKKEIKNILALGARLSESYNYSFVGEEQVSKLNIDPKNCIRLLNPIASQLSLLRTSLAPNLIENVKKNQARHSEFGLFEIGNIYLNTPGDLAQGSAGAEVLPYQEERLGIIIAGTEAERVFLRAKSIVGFLLSGLGLEPKYTVMEDGPGYFDGQISAGIEVKEISIGNVGMLDSQAGKQAGIKKETAIVEISLKKLELLYPQPKNYIEFEKYPPVIRDLSFVIDKKILYNKVKEEIEGFSDLIRSAELFDVYEGEKFGADKKSLAFQIIYQADRTLVSGEVEELQKRLIAQLEDKFGAKVRDF